MIVVKANTLSGAVGGSSQAVRPSESGEKSHHAYSSSLDAPSDQRPLQQHRENTERVFQLRVDGRTFDKGFNEFSGKDMDFLLDCYCNCWPFDFHNS